MINSIRKAWELLDSQERRNAIKVLFVMIIGALSSAMMVGSVFPFLAVLSDPDMIKNVAPLAWVYQTGGFASEYSFLVALGVGAIVVVLLSNMVQIFQTWILARYIQMRVHSISRRLLKHYLVQPYEFFIARHSGQMSSNILSEAQLVVQQFLRPFADLVSSTLTVIAVIATLLLVDPVTASLSIVVFALIYGGVTGVTRRYVSRMGQERARANEERFRVAGEALSGIKDVKLLGREAAYLDRFSAPSSEMARVQIGVRVIAQAPRFAIQIVAFGGIIMICLVLLDPDGLRERAALGGLLPIVGLLALAGQRLIPELQKLYQSITTMTSGTAAVDRVHDDLLGGRKAQLDRNLTTPMGLRKTLVLDGVSYSYPGATEAGVSNVSLSIQAGERIGVVGASGAGKTTLADIVLGLFAPETGTIAADGQVINSDTIRAWQKTVGYVPQDIFVTDASFAQNIAFGLPEAEIDAHRIETAARIAQLHAFAMTELPDGYATMLGERGVRLSGGQRQRIGIARALYQDADLIVFDEATSALDNLTEREVMVAIDALPGDKTLIVIAHRLSTVKVCDRIVVMDKGRVADVGTWDELVSRSEAFRALAEAA